MNKQRHLRRLVAALIAPLASISMVPANGQMSENAASVPRSGSSGWRVRFDSSSFVDYYDNSGEQNNPVFSEEFVHSYSDLNFEISRKPSPFESLTLRFASLLNDSGFRDSEEGLVLENLNLSWEKGDVRLPFRIEAGDYFGFYSLRIMQRRLKGVQFEIQPKGQWQQSAIVSVGTTSARYDDFNFDDDYYAGANYTISPSERTTFGLNAVYNSRTDSLLAPESDQTVFSLVGQKQFSMGTHELTLEAEAAQFTGEVVNDTGNLIEESDQGYFMQLQGRSSRAFDYRVRYEDYGQFFQPNGAAIRPDRRTAEAHAGWRFGNGLHIAGRLQNYLDSKDTPAAVDTDTAGIRVTGPWFGGSTALDALVQTRESEDGTIDVKTQSATLNLAGGIGAGWSARLVFSTQTNEDLIAMIENDVHQVTIGGSRQLRVGQFVGNVSPMIVYRARRGDNGDLDELGPGIGLRMSHDRHSLQLNYASLEQSANDDLSRDNKNHTVNFRYFYTRNRHQIGLEANYQSREPEDQVAIRGSHYRLSYKYSFDSSRSNPVTSRPSIQGATTGEASNWDAFGVNSGVFLADAITELEARGVSGSSTQDNAVIYEARPLMSIAQRQRIVLVADGDVVVSSALIIDFDSIHDQSDMSRTYALVRNELLNQFGAPDLSVERGEFGASMQNDLQLGDFARILEWQAPSGTIRFGIPSRLDGQIRMELQNASGFPSTTQNAWSLEGVY